jgi:hypothetical protein
MKRDQEFETLQQQYPNLFKEYPRSGFGVGDGWSDLLHDLYEVLEDHIKRLPEEIRGDVCVAQIKEKFGTLRFYMTQETPYISGAIAVAESISHRVCEDCGASGTLRKGGWLRTLCDEDYAVQEKRKEESYKAYNLAMEEKKNKAQDNK